VKEPGLEVKALGNIILKPLNNYIMSQTTQDELTLGEKRVRTKFNPSETDIVSVIKQKTAELIDVCEDLSRAGHDKRLVALAQTEFENAGMWAVKAATSDTK
jgi:hypothetical protein